jgi:hypothetical protein
VVTLATALKVVQFTNGKIRSGSAAAGWAAMESEATITAARAAPSPFSRPISEQPLTAAALAQDQSSALDHESF